MGILYGGTTEKAFAVSKTFSVIRRMLFVEKRSRWGSPRALPWTSSRGGVTGKFYLQKIYTPTLLATAAQPSTLVAGELWKTERIARRLGTVPHTPWLAKNCCVRKYLCSGCAMQCWNCAKCSLEKLYGNSCSSDTTPQP